MPSALPISSWQSWVPASNCSKGWSQSVFAIQSIISTSFDCVSATFPEALVIFPDLSPHSEAVNDSIPASTETQSEYMKYRMASKQHYRCSSAQSILCCEPLPFPQPVCCACLHANTRGNSKRPVTKETWIKKNNLSDTETEILHLLVSLPSCPCLPFLLPQRFLIGRTWVLGARIAFQVFFMDGKNALTCTISRKLGQEPGPGIELRHSDVKQTSSLVG